ncbi:MAG: hypothetical protein EP335_06390, partial [Alphaproteobacteria bacterium]
MQWIFDSIPLLRQFARQKACPELTHNLGAYDAQVRPGRGRRLMVVCAGIGAEGRDPMPFEWRASTRLAGLDDHFIFVRDRNRSWMNDPAGFDALLQLVEDYRSEHNIRHTTGFGLSMGGFNALVLDHYLAFDRVVAAAPQLLVGPKAGFDSRYKAFWDQIPVFRHDDAAALMRAEGRYEIHVSVDTRRDLLHLAPVLDRPGVRFLAYRGNHNIGHEMQCRDSLSAYVRAVLLDDQPLPAGLQEAPDRIAALVRHAAKASAADVRALADGDSAWLPTWMYRHLQRDMAAETGADIAPPVPVPADLSPLSLLPYLRAGWREVEPGIVRADGSMHEISMHLFGQSSGTPVRMLLDVDYALAGQDAALLHAG